MSDQQDTIEGTDTQVAQAPPNPKGRSATREDKMRFFDELHKPMRDLATMTGIHEDLLLTLAAYESGWWGAVAQPGTRNLSREKNNPFGYIKRGAKMTFPSLDTALNIFREDKWPGRLGRVSDIEAFVNELQDNSNGKPRYNSEYPDPNIYKDRLRQMYKSVITAKEDWKAQRFSDE